MIRPILKYGDAVLHTPAKPVAEITPDLQPLIDDMIETMYAVPGIGLAAPQIGVGLRIFVVDLSVGRDPAALVTFINPQFVGREGAQVEEEGCLSAPGFQATVTRPLRATVTGLDRHGQPQTVEASGLLARAFEHEMDHLDGTVFIDRLRGIKRELILRRIRKLKKSDEW